MNLLGGVHQRGPVSCAIIPPVLADAARRVSSVVGGVTMLATACGQMLRANPLREFQPSVRERLAKPTKTAAACSINSLHLNASKCKPISPHGSAANMSGGFIEESCAAQAGESLYVLGETLRPLLTNAMGSAIEIFDTKGTPGGGPPPHKHRWEEIYIVLSGEMDVHMDGITKRLGTGGYAHVPANVVHGYTTIDETHFLTIVTKGNAAKFFRQAATEVEMNPPDVAGILRIGMENGITFLV